MPALPFALLVAPPGQPKTVRLRYKPPVGTTYAYALTSQVSQLISGAPGPVTIDWAVPVTVKIVSRTGNQTALETTYGTPRLTISKPDPMGRRKPDLRKALTEAGGRTTLDELANGKAAPLSTGGRLMLGTPQRLPRVSFPLKPVRVGDSWSTRFAMKELCSEGDVSRASINETLPVSYRLVALQKRSGKTFARITMSVKGRSKTTAQGANFDLIVDSFSNALIDLGTGQFESATMVTKTSMTVSGKEIRERVITKIQAK